MNSNPEVADDELARELRGETPLPGNPQLTTLVAPPAPVNPLVVNPPAPLSASQRMDAQHSTAAGGKGYACTISGDYLAMSKDQPGKKIKKPYRVVVNIPSLDRAMTVIKDNLLNGAVKMKHEDFVAVHTHFFDGAVPLSPSMQESNDLAYMSRAGLVDYIRMHKAPIDPAHYPNEKDLRDVVIDFVLNRTGFEEREAKRRAEIAEKQALLDMNPGLSVHSGGY